MLQPNPTACVSCVHIIHRPIRYSDVCTSYNIICCLTSLRPPSLSIRHGTTILFPGRLTSYHASIPTSCVCFYRPLVYSLIVVSYPPQAITLIENGKSDLDAGDVGGQTPTHIACYRVRAKVKRSVNFLIFLFFRKT